MPGCVRYPAPGCIVEYMEGNAVQIAMVTEEVGGRLRLLLPNRRETRLTVRRREVRLPVQKMWRSMRAHQAPER